MKGLRVLVIDDSPITSAITAEKLRKLGNEVVQIVSRGSEALAAYADIGPDLVTMDIVMPDMDGIEATKRIIALDPLAVIVMVTSLGRQSSVVKALAAGARGYVHQPIDDDVLAEVVHMTRTHRARIERGGLTWEPWVPDEMYTGDGSDEIILTPDAAPAEVPSAAAPAPATVSPPPPPPPAPPSAAEWKPQEGASLSSPGIAKVWRGPSDPNWRGTPAPVGPPPSTASGRPYARVLPPTNASVGARIEGAGRPVRSGPSPKAPPGGRPPAHAGDSKGPDDDAKPLRILMIEDSPITRGILIKMLTELGHRVVGTAVNGAEAVEAYRTMRPDLVTMDIVMPAMDGITATRLIIEAFPDARIMMVTSQGYEKTAYEAMDAGARGFVVQPVTKETLRNSIAYVMKSVSKLPGSIHPRDPRERG